MTPTTEYSSYDIRSDAVRNAFTSISRVATPLMNTEYWYPSDLLWDAAIAANMNVGDVIYIIIRDVGTWCCAPDDQTPDARRNKYHEAVSEVERKGADNGYMAVLKLVRGDYDHFHATVAYSASEAAHWARAVTRAALR